jgi:hypothetical protein
MPDTASLGLPLLVAEQAQKHVTHNEALSLIDALVRTQVVDRDLTAPPGSPTEGAIYIPASGATGDWSAWDFNLAYYVGGAWQKIVPKVGWLAYVIDEDKYYKFEGAPTYWVEFASGGSIARELLTADRDYYVDGSSGSDSDDGLSPGTAFATIQKAADVVASLDIGLFTVTINIVDGTYAAAGISLKSAVGSGKIVLLGNTGTPSNVVIESTDGSGRTIAADAVTTDCEVHGVALTHSGGGTAFGLSASKGSRLYFSDVELGSGYSSHILSEENAYIEALGDYEITGAATRHWYATRGGIIRVNGRTITVTGTPDFSVAFAFAFVLGQMIVHANTFSGSATGTRYVTQGNSVIYVAGGGATYLPGDAAGSASTGGESF